MLLQKFENSIQVKGPSNLLSIIWTIGSIRLRDVLVFTIAYALLVVGILYPEAKNSIAGVPWTWLLVVAAFPIFLKICITAEKPRNIIFAYMTIISFVGLWLVFTAAVNADYSLSTHYLFEVTPILLITVPLSATLFSSLNKNDFFLMLDAVALALCFGLLLVRFAQGDYSREGSFLGLGPLTFIKYVGLGLLVRVVLLRRFGFLPLSLYVFAFYIADSKGPLLYVLLTIAAASVTASTREFLKASPLIIILILGLVNNERVQSLWYEVTSLNNVTEVTIQDREVANEEVSGTIVRLASISSSVDLISKNPIFGIGPGRWSIETALPSVEYPHNILLEVWSEWGLAPFILLLITFTISGLAIWHRSIRDSAIPAIYCGLTALSSGSLVDFRFFLIFFLVLMIDRHRILTKRRLCL